MKKLIIIIFLLIPAVLFGQRTFVDGSIIGINGDTIGSVVILNDTTLRFTVNDTIYDLSSGTFLFVSDTAAMLLTYINKSDTAAMLIPYALLSEAILPADTAAMLVTYINKSDTASMLTPYGLLSETILPADTAAMLTTYINKADTAAMLSNYAELTEIVDWEITGAEDIHSDRIQDNLIDHDNLLNFLASEHVVYVGGSGMTLDGTDIDLGGALDAPTTITGTEANNLSINLSDADDRSVKIVFRPADGLSMRAYTGDDYTGDSSYVRADSNLVSMGIYDGAAEKSIKIDTNNTSGILITDDDAGIGLKGIGDFSSVATNLAYTQKIYQDRNLGGQTINATIYSPGDDEHGDLIVWDTNTNTYISADVIPVGQGAGFMVVAFDTILFSNTTVDTIVTLPVGAFIWDIQICVITTFNGSGTDLLDVGIISDAARYEDDLDLAVTIPKIIGLANVADRIVGTSHVIFQYFDSGADASTGLATIYVRYSIHSE